MGDTKELDLGTEGKVLMEIVAFDADDLPDNSGKAKITWISKNCLKTKRWVNSAAIPDGSAGSWSDSGLKTYVNNTIKELLPSGVKNNIVRVTKTDMHGDSHVTYNTYNDIWVPSARELNKQLGEPMTTESSGPVYNLAFPDYLSRSRGENYWLRSWPHAKYCYYVKPDGTLAYVTPTGSYGVVIGFCT